MENTNSLENIDLGNLMYTLVGYGDIHLSSKGHGAHYNYPKESLEYFREVTKVADRVKADYIIGTGDLTYGSFHTLEYRHEVEKELHKQNEITHGNRFEVRGNHDQSSKGMTEYDFYVEKGLIKPSTNLQLGSLNVSMVDYGCIGKTKILTPTQDTTDVVIAHDYVKFKDTQLPNFGDRFIELDHISDWYGVDYILCGHLHHRMVFEGSIIKDGHGHNCLVHYLGCMSRPAYMKKGIDEYGCIWVMTVYDKGYVKYDIVDIPLWDIEKSFNIAKIEEAIAKEEEKQRRIDMHQEVLALNSHHIVVGDPEEKVKSLDTDIRYKNKALDLLKRAL